MKYLFALIFTCLCAISAFGHGNATGAVLERMNGMVSIQAAMKSLAQFAKTDAVFDGKAVQASAQDIAKHAENIPTLFMKQDMSMPTEAKVEIWQEWDKFSQIAQELEIAANTAANAVDAMELKTAMGEMANSCKSCHEHYRIKN